jgi:hypothetical protein
MQHPMPTPKYILALKPSPASNDPAANSICLTINYAPLWEKGDSEEKIINSFASRINLLVDGQNATIDTRSLIFHGPARPVLDTTGNVLGMIGISNACFNTNLTKGTHLATLRLFTTTGVEQSYSWSFSK